MKTAIIATAALIICMNCRNETMADAGSQCWAKWRGPNATGVAPDADPPVMWGEGTNVRWKVSIPGKGHSSPIVCKDVVLVTTAVETDSPIDAEQVASMAREVPGFHAKTASVARNKQQFTVMAFKRSDGSLLWRRQVCEEAPTAGTHRDGSWASGSPVTDGEYIYAFFGTHGLYCLDMKGNIKWGKRLGAMKVKASFGEGASPALYGDTVFANWDHEGPSFVAAFDRKSGEEKWRKERDEITSWSTPVMAEKENQLIISAANRIRSYDPANGNVLWECGGMTQNVIPCPVSEKGMVYCMSGFRGSAMIAIRLDAAAGDITEKTESTAWRYDRDTPYVPSPLLYDGLLYFIKANSGVLSCLDAATGGARYEKQVLQGIKEVYSSPVGAGGRIYVTGRNGLTFVLKKGPAFEVMATNTLDESFTASAAIAGSELFLRGQKHLYCIAGADKR